MSINFASPQLTVIFILLILWTIPWKGVALWKAAQNKQLVWFIAILILNTFAILEITYIFFFSKKRKSNES
jgi:methionyl-tRNA synthetase